MNRTVSKWESLEIGVLLALSGGLMDAYSYMCRGQVFANAQTGNMLLMGVNISQGKWSTALRYLCPVLLFVAGIAVADIARMKFHHIGILKWRQLALIIEAIALVTVGFLPYSLNLLANSLTSFACGIQVESFRKIHGNGIATTMCIGNLRSATQNICDFWNTKDRSSFRKGLLYYGIIGVFVIGAVIGNELVNLINTRAIWFSSIILMCAFFFLLVDAFKERKKDMITDKD